MSVKAWRVRCSAGSALLTGAVQNEVLILIYSPSEKRAAVIAIKKSAIIEGEIEDALANTELEAQRKTFEAKIVGANGDVEKAKRICHRLGITVRATQVRENLKFEFMVDPQSGRLQIEKQTSTVNSMKPSSTSAPPPPLNQTTAPPKKIIRVLIIDDSATIRKLLTSIFSSDSELRVVGALANPLDADATIDALKPDVITLDIHMPEMNGVTLLKKIQPKYNIPTVMITSVSPEEGPLVLDALEAGAFDYFQKPSLNEVKNLSHLMIEKIKAAAYSKQQVRKVAETKQTAPIVNISQSTVVAIGSSTGGTEALREVLTRLPRNIPPVVIVQHIPAVFSLALANRLNDLCPFEVREARDGDVLKPNLVLIAPGGQQMAVVADGGKGYKIRITDAPPVNRHKPSVDVLFDSVADVIGKNTIGVVLTGMGADGAKGLLKMKQKGSRTLAQDEATSVVFGMPKEAIRLGAADEVVPLDAMASKLVSFLAVSKAA